MARVVCGGMTHARGRVSRYRRSAFGAGTLRRDVGGIAVTDATVVFTLPQVAGTLHPTRTRSILSFECRASTS